MLAIDASAAGRPGSPIHTLTPDSDQYFLVYLVALHFSVPLTLTENKLPFKRKET